MLRFNRLNVKGGGMVYFHTFINSLLLKKVHFVKNAPQYVFQILDYFLCFIFHFQNEENQKVNCLVRQLLAYLANYELELFYDNSTI